MFHYRDYLGKPNLWIWGFNTNYLMTVVSSILFVHSTNVGVFTRGSAFIERRITWHSRRWRNQTLVLLFFCGGQFQHSKWPICIYSAAYYEEDTSYCVHPWFQGPSKPVSPALSSQSHDLHVHATYGTRWQIIYIQQGDDDTFGPFPQRLRELADSALPAVNVVTVVYPKYETRGDLKECVGRFREWFVLPIPSTSIHY